MRLLLRFVRALARPRHEPAWVRVVRAKAGL
jgi:hypothetical protein